MKAYAIKDPKGKVKIQDIKEFEDECIDCFLDSFLICITWQILKSQGYRCVPVEITEIKPKPLSGEALKALHKAIKASAKKSTELKGRK